MDNPSKLSDSSEDEELDRSDVAAAMFTSSLIRPSNSDDIFGFTHWQCIAKIIGCTKGGSWC